MKKLDYLIIIIVAIISISFYTIYIVSKNLRDEVDIQILYQNEVIYETPLTKETEITVFVVGIDNEVIVTVDGQSKSYDYLFKEPFYNTILITNKEIKMIDASCKNHDCMRMQMNPLFHTPIVCINGIIVKMVSRDIEIIS
ncbi:MAG TPA: NusG domain II-containing protein [Bacilli bacterium]|nr:NusG domain II-containing protein [Bacilli bacterium]